MYFLDNLWVASFSTKVHSYFPQVWADTSVMTLRRNNHSEKLFILLPVTIWKLFGLYSHHTHHQRSPIDLSFRNPVAVVWVSNVEACNVPHVRAQLHSDISSIELIAAVKQQANPGCSSQQSQTNWFSTQYIAHSTEAQSQSNVEWMGNGIDEWRNNVLLGSILKYCFHSSKVWGLEFPKHYMHWDIGTCKRKQKEKAHKCHIMYLNAFVY